MGVGEGNGGRCRGSPGNGEGRMEDRMEGKCGWEVRGGGGVEEGVRNRRKLPRNGWRGGPEGRAKRMGWDARNSWVT